MLSSTSQSLTRLYLRRLVSTLHTTHLRTMATAMSKRLEGKTILITGASSGIGKSTAQEFARTSPKNLKIIVTARRLDSLKQLAEEIKKEVGEGVKVHPVQLDVSNASEIRAFIDKLPEEFKQIDVLVNNAGLVKGVDQVGNIKEEDLNVMFATNVTGLINMTQAVLPLMKSRRESGQGDIINIGSIAGRDPYTEGSIYCATKAAVRSFTESMRKELIATRIRIIEIDPGQVETEFSVVRFYGDKSKAEAVYAGCEPLTPDDIAEVIVFAAGRRENVVIADTLIFPNHQVSRHAYRTCWANISRHQPRFYTRRVHRSYRGFSRVSQMLQTNHQSCLTSLGGAYFLLIAATRSDALLPLLQFFHSPSSLIQNVSPSTRMVQLVLTPASALLLKLSCSISTAGLPSWSTAQSLSFEKLTPCSNAQSSISSCPGMSL